MIRGRRRRAGNRRQHGRGAGPGTWHRVTSRSRSGPVAPSSRHRPPIVRRRGEVAGFADAAGRYLATRVHAQRHQGHRVGRRHSPGDKASDLDRIGALAPPGANGVTCSCRISTASERPYCPRPAGTLSGIRTTTTVADIVRASVEGVISGLLARRRRTGALRHRHQRPSTRRRWRRAVRALSPEYSRISRCARSSRSTPRSTESRSARRPRPRHYLSDAAPTSSVRRGRATNGSSS